VQVLDGVSTGSVWGNKEVLQPPPGQFCKQKRDAFQKQIFVEGATGNVNDWRC